MCHEKWIEKQEHEPAVQETEPTWQFVSDEKEAEPAPVKEPERELVNA